jgi:polyhydroxybutyrate depolymerase
VVYLDGYKGHWNDSRKSIDFAARKEGLDDVAFAEAVMDEIGVTPVYVFGFSNGGAMVIRLLHEIPGRLAGAMVVSATQPAPENFAPARNETAPVPLLLMHGTKDPLVPYAGGMATMPFGLNPRGLGLSAPATAEYFARRNGITSEPTESTADDITRTSYQGTAPVSLITNEGGGHVIPNPGRRAPRLVMGHQTASVSAADEFRVFFGI